MHICLSAMTPMWRLGGSNMVLMCAVPHFHFDGKMTKIVKLKNTKLKLKLNSINDQNFKETNILDQNCSFS